MGLKLLKELSENINFTTMAHPLLCWDICEEGLSRRMQLANDLKIMKKLMKEGNGNPLLAAVYLSIYLLTFIFIS